MSGRPLTPGEIVDLAGLRLTKAQARKARVELERMGYTIKERSDGQLVALERGPIETRTRPNFDAI